MIIGVMGMSGSGKTTFCSYLKDMGGEIIDADKIAREVLDKGSAGLLEVKEKFGEDIILPDGSLDRKKLGEIVFKDETKLASLNLITHRRINNEIKKRALESKSDIVVIDCPMLHKIDAKNICDKIILIKADKEDMIKRIVERDNITPEIAEARIDSQISDFESAADTIIENNGDISLLHTRAKLLINGKDENI